MWPHEAFGLKNGEIFYDQEMPLFQCNFPIRTIFGSIKVSRKSAKQGILEHPTIEDRGVCGYHNGAMLGFGI